MAIEARCDEDEVSADWLAEVLRDAGALAAQRVSVVRSTQIGMEIGFLSRTLRVELEYDGPSEGAPRSLIVKQEPAPGPYLAAERNLSAFEREIRFYREIAPRVALRLPRIYHAEVGPSGAVLVMEDLSRLRFVDQVRGLHQGEVMQALREVAKLHAVFWDAVDQPSVAWMPAYEHFWEEDLAEHWPAFADEYGLRIGPEGMRLGERVVGEFDRLAQAIRARPATVIHGDLRADNLLFGADGAYLLDWQLATRSIATIDVARLLGGSEPTLERRGRQLEVVAGWHDALREAGVQDYGLEEATCDFRRAVLYCLLIPIRSFSFVGANSGRRTARLVDAQAERFFASAVEMNAGVALD
jgi:thiamine kinase-like enzyme